MVLNLTDYGKKRANPCACPQNALKLEKGGCCRIDSVPSCKDSIILEPDAVISGIKFNGKIYDFNKDHFYENKELLVAAVGNIPASEKQALQEHVLAILPAYEFNTWARVTETADGKCQLCHIGGCILDAVILEDGTEVTGERCCDVVIATKWQTSLLPAETDFSFDGGAPKALDLAAGADEAANIAKAAAAQTVIEGCVGGNAKDVSVVFDASKGIFVINLKTAKPAPLVGGVAMTNCGISSEFMCSE